MAWPGLADELEDWTCDRRECFDARGRLVLPDHFGEQQGAGLDPCAALSSDLRLEAGETGERVFLLGYAETPDAARQLATLAAAMPAVKRIEQVRGSWDRLLGATTVKTPDPLFDAMVNRWLLYQTVACRLWAKAGFYQAGGATGFRDQLQDTMALAWAAPEMLREQIVLCASRQFAEGDVQHWWHAPTGAGVRTHFSDDLLWLVHACVHYLRATGDAALLDQSVPFIEGGQIPEGAEDAYYTPTVSTQHASVYEHAARSIDRSLRVGVHGLPLMGSGDWNDGMNRVGHEGRGESVWLAWFLCQLVADFAPQAHARGDAARALRWESAASGWRVALNGPAWDGQWFKRAFFDDGQALGSHANAEARIDLIAQAWGVLSKVAPPHLQRIALAAVEEHLVDRDSGLIKLLDPPLAHASPSAGYIQAYPPGVRENGGQYSHAGVWALMAQAQLAGARSGARRAFGGRHGVPILHLPEPGAPRPPPGAWRSVWHRALRDGGGRVHPAALCRAWWLELVHRRGGLVAPCRHRIDVRLAPRRTGTVVRALPAVALATRRTDAQARRPHDALHPGPRRDPDRARSRQWHRRVRRCCSLARRCIGSTWHRTPASSFRCSNHPNRCRRYCVPWPLWRRERGAGLCRGAAKAALSYTCRRLVLMAARPAHS